MEGCAANGDEGERLRDGGVCGDDDVRWDLCVRDVLLLLLGMVRGSGVCVRLLSGGVSVIRGVNAARA